MQGKGGKKSGKKKRKNGRGGKEGPPREMKDKIAS